MNGVDLAGARAEGEEQLAELGFVQDGAGIWRSGVADEVTGVPLVVLLPARFPYDLPVVGVDRKKLPRQVPHVEKSGKVCIAASAGLMVDATRPRAVVQQAVARARDIIGAGLRNENSDDLLGEFNSYWSNVENEVLSFCAPGGEPRLISVGEVEAGRPEPRLVVADTRDQLRLFADRLAMRLRTTESAYFIPLSSPVMPPSFDDVTSVRLILSMLSDLDPEAQRCIGEWRPAGQPNPLFILSFRADDDIVFGLRLQSRLPRTASGFRPGKLRLKVAMEAASLRKMDRVGVQRADQEFLRRRTGSVIELKSKRVAIVGCGAIGGFLATTLADAGVGKLTLIDEQKLRAENAMRHILGLAAVGASKAEALRALIQSRLPHVDVDARTARIEQVLEQDVSLAQEHDLVLLATGDQTLELWTSEKVRRKCQLVHVWVEAYGVGGHVLVDGHGAPGCLGCLFEPDPDEGLVCRASLFAPGQKFTSSIFGCAGAFTPFGSMDAQRAAIEGARAAVRTLTGVTRASTLITWLESMDPFETGSLVPSGFARSMSVGSRTEILAHAGCPRCR